MATAIAITITVTVTTTIVIAIAIVTLLIAVIILWQVEFFEALTGTQAWLAKTKLRRPQVSRLPKVFVLGYSSSHDNNCSSNFLTEVETVI